MPALKLRAMQRSYNEKSSNESNGPGPNEPCLAAAMARARPSAVSCGVRPFGRGYVEQIGGDFVSINLAVLDDATDEELAGAPVQFMNGRDNDWFNVPRETRYL